MRWAAWSGGLLLALLVLVGLLLALLDTSPGKRFLIDRIAARQAENGLVIRIGRIDGSIYADPKLVDVRLSDPDGLFLTLNDAAIDWHPLQFLLANRLDIDRAVVTRAHLLRRPRFKPTENRGWLPDFDIRIGDFALRRIDVDRAVAGRGARGSMAGRADVRAGRLMVDGNLGLSGGERAEVHLDARPDDGVFAARARVNAPAGGVIAGLIGAKSGLTALLQGTGNWQAWRGSLAADAGSAAGSSGGAGKRLARLQLAMARGDARINGRIWPQDWLGQDVAALVGADGLAITSHGRIDGARWHGDAAFVAAAVQLDMTGGFDAGDGRLQALRFDVRSRPAALMLAGVAARRARAAILLDGPWSGPNIEYQLDADALTLAPYHARAVHAAGRGSMARALALPLHVTAAWVDGIAPNIDPMLRRLTLDAQILRQNHLWRAQDIRLSAPALQTTGNASFSPTNGNVAAQLTGGFSDITIPNVARGMVRGHVAIEGRLGVPLALSGRVEGDFARITNPSIATLLGGRLRVTSNFALGQDGIWRFAATRLVAPKLQAALSGQYQAGGQLRLTARGSHSEYSGFTADVAGVPSAPRIALSFYAPIPALQVRQLRLTLEPQADGFAIAVAGGSMLGPFHGTGALLLPTAGAARVRVDDFLVSDTRLAGQVTLADGAMAGALTLSGGGVNGTLTLQPSGGVQQILAQLNLRDAQFAGPPAISIHRGQVAADVRLAAGGANVTADFELAGVERGALFIDQAAGNLRLRGGRGLLTAALSGDRGRAFNLQTRTAIRPGALTINVAGSLAARAVSLTRPAELTRVDGGWQLAPAEVRLGGGRAQISGILGAETRIDAGFDALPLALLDLVSRDLAARGLASGRVHYFAPATGNDSGDMQVRISGFNRVGLGNFGDPVDIALNANLTGNGAALRGVVSRGGASVSRIQARLAPLGSGSLGARLANAPLFAQIRYSGDAAKLWALTGIDALSIAGPVAIAADVGGTISNPRINGSLRMIGGRVEGVETGTIVTNVAAEGRFDGTRLHLSRLSGVTAGDGSVSGTGDVSLSAADGFPMQLQLRAARALLLNRDDLTARVSGPLTVSRSAAGNRISGQFTLDAGRFRLGRATALDALPVINVTEINLPAGRRRVAGGAPWQLDFAVTGGDSLRVEGMGIDSIWSTDLNVRGDVRNFAITGDARLVRGDYVFAGRRFQLERGTIHFDGSSPANPSLDIVASDDMAGIDATINVRGTGNNPEISFASTPALPEDELLSRILFGSSITDISVTEAAQLGLALAALRDGGGGLDPINAIRRATGLDRLRILPADSVLGTGTAVAAGKYVTRRIYVEVISDGQGYSATRAEFQITRWLAILGSISTIGRESVNLRIQRDY